MSRHKIIRTMLLFTAVLSVLGICGRIFEAPRFPLCFTEICTGDSLAYDDNGNYSAYIEISNVSDKPVDMKGWGLGNDTGPLFIYDGSDIVIDPGSVVMVWSSAGEDLKKPYRKEYKVRDIHDPGLVIQEGEKLLLTDPEGRAIDNITVPTRMPDGETYSTAYDRFGTFSYGLPSPYYIDAGHIRADSDESLDEPVYSVEGGWYDGDISVEISGVRGDIYYTTDGTDPDESSHRYEGPITITDRSPEPDLYTSAGETSTFYSYTPEQPVDKCTVLKSVVIRGGKRSPVKAATFFIGLDDDCYRDIPTISISMSPEDLFSGDRGIYVIGDVYSRYMDKFGEEDIRDHANYAKEGRGWERRARIEYYTAGHEKKLDQKIGIRIHGNLSAIFDQKSFNLYAREKYDGSPAFRYDFFNDAPGNGLCRKLMLRNGGDNEMFVTKMRDVLLQSFAAGLDIGTQRYIPCNVFLNGEYWGLYNLQETIGEGYLKEHYGTSDDNVLIVKNGTPDEDRSGYEGLYSDVLEYAEKNDLSAEDNYRHMEELIDIQSCIDFYATEIYMANVDLYSNVAMWRAISPSDDGYNDGRWRWLLYDLDETAGLFTGMSDADTDSFTDGHWEDRDPLDSDVLFTALMRNKEFKRRFTDTMTKLADDDFSYEKTSAMLHDMARIYKNPLIKSHLRYRGDYTIDGYEPGASYTPPYTEEDFAVDIRVIDDFLRDRGRYIREYMERDLKD